MCIPVRAPERADDATEPAPLWQPSFPSAELVQHAADLIPHIAADAVGESGVLTEGPRWEIVVSAACSASTPATVPARSASRSGPSSGTARTSTSRPPWEGDMPEPLPTRGTITAWTRRSRARLVERLSDLDYTRLYGRFHVCDDCREEYDEHLDHGPACRSVRRSMEDRRGRLPTVLMLTRPGDWLTVAPDADTATKHFQTLCKRYARTWGEPLRGP